MMNPDEPPPGAPVRRQRAPTITIDTSAVSTANSAQQMDSDAVPLRALPNLSVSQESSSPSNTEHASSIAYAGQGSMNSKGSVAELRKEASFESTGDSRPQSPHNISSPTSRGNVGSGYLSVPALGRSRQNSVDSDDGYHSSSSFGAETTLASGGSMSYLDRKSTDTRTVEHGRRNSDIMKDQEALKPDPGTEADFNVEDNKFAFTPGLLNKLINPKSLPAFYALGGLRGLEKGLRTDRRSGLSVDETNLDGTVSFDDVRSGPSPAGDSKSPVTRTSTHKSTASRKQRNLEGGFADRRRIFSDNRLPEKKGKSIFELMWITYNDKVLILLSIAAVVSLAVGLYQSLGTHHAPGVPSVEWVEGVAIVVAIVVVVVVGSANDYQKERQFVKLNKKKQDRIINIIRSGKTQEVSVFDILAGDVVHLEAGDAIPVDGIFIDGHNVKCDESQTTGESDLIKKKPADEVFEAIEAGEDVRKMDPFILSGAQVTDGVGTYLATSTGVNSSHGKIMMSLREDPEVTPLQSKLNTLAEYIAKLGGAAGLLLFIVLFIEFLSRLPHDQSTPTEKGQAFLNIFIVTVTIIVVAVPEGLPLAVTLALAFATTRMLKDNNMVRHLKACEVMGNATAICSDKTGTLTQNKMTVVAGTIGTNSRFGGSPVSSSSEIPEDDGQPKGKQTETVDNTSPQDFAKTLSDETKAILIQSIAINSTAFEGEVDGEHTFIGSKTETALLTFAKTFLGMGPVDTERHNATVAQLIPFDSKRKCMGIVIKLENGKYRLLVKGASEILLEHCAQIINDATSNNSDSALSDENRQTLNSLITNYAERSLRTIGLVYKDFSSWPPPHARRADGEQKEALFEDVFKNMIMLGVVGIQDPLREGVKEAVETCQNAGVIVRMVTGDNMTTAKAIATECGIFTPGGLVMEGPTFRRLSLKEMQQIIPNLQVLARSSPEDKRILVKRLKELGETVAVTGDGTNDAPALKTADVGFSMGIAGTEVAKEASAIILMDDNFGSIVKAMMWGRAVNDAVKKFLQFQVTVNITAVLLTFISAVSSSDEESVLTAVQLLWVNLIMDTMAALALATDPPTRSILNRKPDPKSAPLISVTMWKMIIGQAIYQMIVTLTLYFGAEKILGYSHNPTRIAEIPTIVFNTFVWMQIFNSWNNRRLDNKFNIFEGITNNSFFIGINVVMVGGQVLIVFVGGAAFSVTPLDGVQWAICLVLGFLSIPIGALLRCVPDALCVKFYRKLVNGLLFFVPPFLKTWWVERKKPKLTIEEEEGRFYFPQPLTDVKEELSFLKKMKGGRINNLVFAIQNPGEVFTRSRSNSHSRSGSVPTTPTDITRENSTASNKPSNKDTVNSKDVPTAPGSAHSAKRSKGGRSRSNSALGATAVMAGIIAGSVAGWSPIERGHEGEGEGVHGFSRARGRNELESREGVEVHPQTARDDPIITEEPTSFEEGIPPSQVDGVGPAVGSNASSGNAGRLHPDTARGQGKKRTDSS